MITRWLTVLTLAATLVGFASCGDSGSGGGGGGSTTSGKNSGEKTKVGLLVVGTTSDGGWNQQAKEALDKIAGPENLDVRVRQDVKQDGAADAIRQFDAQGYALVIAHGYEYLQAAKELTDPAKNPVKVKIAVSGGDVDNPNFQSLLYDLEGASYQLGIIAAKVSKTGKLGFIGGAKFPTVVAMQRGFQAGAKSVNPNATFAEAWPGWDDPSKAKREAEAFIAQGVDVIMQNVDAASRGVFEAVKEENSKEKAKSLGDVYTFGANSDQNNNPVCPDYTLASAVIKMDKAFDTVVKEVKDGKFKGGIVKEDVANGVAVAVLNPKLTGKVIDAETQKLVDEAAKKIADGSISIPK
jgi:basic membrane protein A